MVDNAWAWAEKHSKLRDNEIHGEQEAKLILDDTFSFKESEGIDYSQEKNVVAHVPCLMFS